MAIKYHAILNECWYHGLKVVQRPTRRGFKKNGFPVILDLEVNGKIIKHGVMEFEQNSKELEAKIEEVYRHYHSRIN